MDLTEVGIFFSVSRLGILRKFFFERVSFSMTGVTRLKCCISLGLHFKNRNRFLKRLSLSLLEHT